MPQGVGKRLSPEEKLEVISRYHGGESSETIGKSLGVTDVAIRATLRRAGVARRDMHACHRKYFCDPSAFTHTTVEGAYWLGFFAADGYVSTDGRMELALAKEDGHHLQAFRLFLKSGHTVREKPNCFWFGVRHPDLVKNLASYEIKNKKSLTLRVHSSLEMNPHFWRGMLDGDGWIAAPSNCPQISLVGSKDSTTQFKAFCSSIVPGVDFYHQPHPSSPVWYVRVHGDNARHIATCIYGPDGPSLERKQRVARSWSTDVWLEDALSFADETRQIAKTLLLRAPPYYEYSEEEISKSFTALFRYNLEREDHIPFSSVGRDAADVFQQKIRWNTCGSFVESPNDRWKDEHYLQRGLTRLRRKKEELTESNLRRWLLRDGPTATQFPPNVAKTIYQRTGATRILDPCAGWGDRLCSALATDTVLSYHGFDTNPDVHAGYEKLINRFPSNKDIQMYHLPFEDIENPDERDLVFTSPPYYNLELYNGRDPYASIDSWVSHMISLISLAVKALVPGGHLAIALAPMKLRRKEYDLPSLFSNEVKKSKAFIQKRSMTFDTNFGGGRGEEVGLWCKI